MRKRDDSLLTVLNEVFVALPWWVGPPAVAATYILFAVILPPLIAVALPAGTDPTTAAMSRPLAQILVPLPAKLAPLMTLAVLAIWAVSLVQKAKRGVLLKQAGDIDRLKEISWHDFELLVGEYYRRRGFRVEERGGSSADGGVDLVLRKVGQTTLVQCKHWKAFKVGVKPVRELGGVMGHERANGGILVTSGRFTAEAEAFARQNRIELVSGGQLVEMVHSVQGTGQRAAVAQPTSSPQRPAVDTQRNLACPKCGEPMVLRTTRKGANAGNKFWGCKQFPACSGTRNL